MFLRKDGEERLREKRKRFEFVAANRESENGKVHGAGAKAIEEHGGDFFDYGELDLGKSFREDGENARKKVRRDGGNGADRDGAAD